MNESFLWYLWRYRLYHHDLLTTEGEPVTVEYPGQQNDDSGPDFSHAKVRIGNTLWAGNVEVHVRSGDWIKHGHQYDKAFDNVIMHVVFENDVDIHRASGQRIPVVELKGKFDENRWESYRRLMKSSRPIPCSASVGAIDKILILQWLDRTLISRLERKTKYVNQLMNLYRGSHEETFYQMLAANFGFKVNALPFELLARSLEYKVILRHSGLLQTEALLFGQAGLLEEEFKDEYPERLQKEYIYLRKKLSLQPVEARLWKFSRMHPKNFPTLRISQFANLIHSKPYLLSSILNAADFNTVKNLLSTNASSYWDTHYTFENSSPFSEKKLGASAIENLIINTLVPFQFAYGKLKGDQHLCDRAVHWLENCGPENNTIIRNWEQLGIEVESAYYSQSLIELKNEYCQKKNCLNCGIGLKLLQENKK